MPPENTPPQTPKDNALKTIRTYESDVAEVLKKDNVTKATIALAESKRAAEQAKVPEMPAFERKALNLSSALPTGTGAMRLPWKLIGMVVGFLALVGIGVLIYFGVKWAREGNATDAPAQNTPVKTDAFSITINENETRAAIIEKIRKGVRDAPIQVGEVREIPVRSGGAPLTTGGLLETLEARAPASLVRALDPRVTLGIHGFRGAQPFLLLPVLSYDRAFADMLTWEREMLDDVGPLFGVSARGQSGAVGSSTAEVLAQDLRLKDAIIRNKDARALFDKDGAIIFLYSFLDKQTLLITTNEDTLRVLQNKVSGGRLKLPIRQ